MMSIFQSPGPKRVTAERADLLAERMLRWSLGLVYVWFGALKLVGMSPVLELIRTTTPSFSALPFYLGLAVFEMAVGVALLFRVWTRWAAAAVVLHLVGTFSILVSSPQVAFLPQFPFLTMDGEFIVKNLVLIAAAGALWLRRARPDGVRPAQLRAATVAFLVLAVGLGVVGARVHTSTRSGAEGALGRSDTAGAVAMSTAAVGALTDEGRPLVVSGIVVDRCPFLGCWLKLQDGSGTLFVDLAPADIDISGIPVGSAVEVSGVIGKTRDGKVGFVASRVQAVREVALR